MDTNSTTHATSEVSGGDDQGGTRAAVRVTAAGVALALIATLTLIGGVSPASAGSPSTSGFTPPVVELGGTSHASLSCPADAGQPATVNVTYNGGPTKGYGFLVGGSPLGPEYVWIDASPDGDNHVIDTDLVGDWSVEVICPSYDPVTLPFRVEATASLDVVSYLDLDNDCTTIEDVNDALIGDLNRVCFAVTNHTGKDIRQLVAVNGQGSGRTFAAGEFPDGSTVTVLTSGSHWLDPAGEILTDLYAWAELGTLGSADFVTSDRESIVVPALPPALDLQTTVALAENDACATDGGTESLTVAPGTEVWVCYRMTNEAHSFFDTHTLGGPTVGKLLDAVFDNQYSGENRTHKMKLTVTENLDLTATWTAVNIDSEESASATDGATVSVEVAPLADPEPTTTTTAPADVAADNGEAVPAEANDTTEIEGVAVLATSAQPKYAG